MKLFFALSLLLASLALTGGDLAAATPPSRAVFALIVTNNRSPGLARPDLRYADDDGAKYYNLFRMIASEENTVLLTELDSDTEKLFPDLKSKIRRPERREVIGAAQAIAARAKQAMAAGKTVEFYFVFAGHGDVEAGRGFVELADSSFTSDDLQSLLQSIPATHAHVILDSCNSFFVINARKPGGQRFPTSQDAARSLSERMPNVGVFLSTNAAAEVFEWSEIQSGIFSHAVRSGLSGAADVNGDGVVSYAELRAYVSIASADLKNPLHRPQVYARGPGGRDLDALVDLTAAEGATIHLPAAGRARLTLRDAADLPWIDLHKEDAFAVILHLPRRVAEGAVLQERDVTSAGSRERARQSVTLDAAGNATLAMLAPLPDSSARGAGDFFRLLFATPFGPRSLATFERAERDRPSEVYGVSREDRERMRLLLDEVADVDRRDRYLGGSILVGVGALTGVLGAELVLHPDTRDPNAGRIFGWSLVGVGGGTAIAGAITLFSRSSGEKLHDDFVEGLRLHADDPRLVVADAERRLKELAESDHTSRLVLRWLEAGVGVLGGAVLVLNATSDRPTTNGVFAGTFMALTGAVGVGTSFIPTPRERIWRLWSEDPGLQRAAAPSISLVPGGGILGLAGRF